MPDKHQGSDKGHHARHGEGCPAPCHVLENRGHHGESERGAEHCDRPAAAGKKGIHDGECDLSGGAGQRAKSGRGGESRAVVEREKKRDGTGGQRKRDEPAADARAPVPGGQARREYERRGERQPKDERIQKQAWKA